MNVRLVFLLALLTVVILPAQADIAADTVPWCQTDDPKPDEGKDGKPDGEKGKGKKGAEGEEAEPECD